MRSASVLSLLDSEGYISNCRVFLRPGVVLPIGAVTPIIWMVYPIETQYIRGSINKFTDLIGKVPDRGKIHNNPRLTFKQADFKEGMFAGG